MEINEIPVDSGVSTEVVETQEAPAAVQTPVEILPDTSIDKTKEQFQKLLDSNRRLNEANNALKQQVQQAQQPVSQPAETNVAPGDFIDKDPVTGERFFNEEKFAAKMTEIQKAQQEIAEKTARAENTIQNYLKLTESREVERQEKETFGAYPELNPNAANFNSLFNKQVRGVLIDSFQNPLDYEDSRPLSFKEAADLVKNAQGKTTQVAAEEAQAQIETASQEAQQLKEQVTSNVPSQPRAEQAMNADEDLEKLKYRTRYLNDDNALAERIKHSEHILTNEKG
jgi:hypothetical protein